MQRGFRTRSYAGPLSIRSPETLQVKQPCSLRGRWSCSHDQRQGGADQAGDPGLARELSSDPSYLQNLADEVKKDLG
jgi:hypothetical protein